MTSTHALAVALVVVLGTAPAASSAASSAPTERVPTVFLGDGTVGGYGIAPVDESRLSCVRAQENLPDVIEDQLADQSILLDITADVSCAGAELRHVWEQQELGGDVAPAPPQKRVLTKQTQLVVAGLGAHTLGLGRILKQCSAKLRGTEGSLLPDGPVDTASKPADCAAYFAKGAGADWLTKRFEQVDKDLEKLFSEIGSESPSAKAVLVGYPRLVPKDVKRCRTVLPGGAGRPLADVPESAWPFLDQKVQARLNSLMAKRAKTAGAVFVDLYAATGAATACDGDARTTGGLLEPSAVTLLHQRHPWFLHPNETGRDTNGDTTAQAIATGVFGRGPA
ncbi:SGNH/GDSL hydrolase family protein [Streptomyces sp. NPDC048604]|uniref:SGNH/GDSL hydrolase family protein n=1 Tax=Streptomyces sp. NPDC048604 TaxID=3365578 RepID=UPI00371427F0